ncbi:hypothetical protein [Salinibacterium sp. CAN_S4]|uniref:hypothetical protein n=1 Tax=Salinibacterium sp. CAN_S4 TaxID=2787727 RepID=UPI003FA7CD92
MARELGRSPSSISRELRRYSCPITGAYRPYAAQKRCVERARRPKLWRLDDPVLAAAVQERLVKGTNLNTHSPGRLLEVASERNHRPRKTLDEINTATAMTCPGYRTLDLGR